MRLMSLTLLLSTTLAGCAMPGAGREASDPMRVVSERTVTGFTFPESVGCDASQNVLYVSQFGGEKLNPLGRDGNVQPLGAPLGQLDGVHELRDGSLLITDWKSGSLVQWSAKDGMRTLAKDFKGPADFCVMGDTAYVPDLVKSELRIVKLGR